jgi:hypothetical protein
LNASHFASTCTVEAVIDTIIRETLPSRYLEDSGDSSLSGSESATMAITDERPFKATDKKLGKALTEAGQDRPRVLPVYQRRFSWTEEQIGRLLDDAQLIVDGKSTTDRSHFAGAMVFSHEPKGGRAIIDGQQRLTTLLLALLAAGSRLKSETNQEHVSQGDKYIEMALTSENPPTLLILPDEQDLRQAHAVVDSLQQQGIGIAPFPSPGPWRSGKYYKAFTALQGRFADDALTASAVIDLIEALLNHFYVARILVEDSVWGAEVFSSLNDSGAPLKPADLVRVYLYSRFSKDSEGADDADAFMRSEWHDFEARFEADPDRLGDFYYHYASAHIDEFVTRGRLLNVLRSHWDALAEPHDILTEIIEWADAYQLVVGDTPTSGLTYQRDFLEAVRRLQRVPNANSYWTYAIQLVHHGLARSRDRKKVAGCLRTIESFIVRKTLHESQVAGIRRLLLPLFKGKGTNHRNAVGCDKAKLRKALGKINKDLRGPTDDELRDSLMNLEGNYYSSSRCRYLLAVRERHLRASSPASALRAPGGLASFEVILDSDLDHIYPQTPSGNWRLVKGQLEGHDFDAIANNLGNLTLLESPLNQKRNSSTLKSLDECYSASSFVGLEKIVVTTRRNSNNGKPLWTLRNMRSRSRLIADFALTNPEGWPCPWD